MPRSRSSARSSGSRSVSSRPAPPPPAPQKKAPPPAVQQQQSGGMMQGLGATIMEGFAFGTGSAMARQAVGAIFGGGTSNTPQQEAPNPSQPPIVQHIDRPPAEITSTFSSSCDMDRTAFNNCMNENNNMISSCDFYFQALQQCQSENKNYSSV